MEYEALRRSLAVAQRLPFHPQWHSFRYRDEVLGLVAAQSTGLVVDVGCGAQRPRPYVEARGAEYLGIDYLPTATGWYRTRPSIFGAAAALPVGDGRADCVLLLDVIEHLGDAEGSLREAHRVLRVSGTVVIQVPFLYPIHDAPLDFRRWTSFGLMELASRTGFTVLDMRYYGEPCESGALLLNIALCKAVLGWIRDRRLAAVSVVLLPLLVVAINVLGWAVARIAQPDGFMPIGYRVVLRKDGSADTVDACA